MGKCFRGTNLVEKFNVGSLEWLLGLGNKRWLPLH